MTKRINRKGVGATLCALTLSTVLLYAGWAQTPKAAAAANVRILYPATRTVHSRITRLILATDKAAISPKATFDGKPLALKRFAFADTWAMPSKLKATGELIGDRANAAVWATALDLKPGNHVVTVGGKRLELRGAKDAKTAAPTGWTCAVSHRSLAKTPGQLDCDACHDLTGGTLGESRTPQVCAACHDDTTIQLAHSHVPQPLSKCAMCHDPHEASRPKLLVDAKNKLCAKCHDAGHFK